MGVYSLKARVELIDWPDVTHTTDLFVVEIKACRITNNQWTISENDSSVEYIEYVIATPKINYELTFDIDPVCGYETQILLFDGSNFNLHDSSIMPEIDSIATNMLRYPAISSTAKSVTVGIFTSDLTIDSNGSSPAPVYVF